MASVRLTGQLRDQIHRKAMHAFGIANPEPMPSTEFVTLLTQAIPRMPCQIGLRKMKKIYEDEIHGAKSFGCASSKILNKTIDTVSIEWSDDAFSRSKTILFEPKIPISVLRIDTNSYYTSFTSYIEDYAQEDRTQLQEYATDLFNRRNENKEAENQYRHKVRDLLNRCNTLKQLLEVWPAAENLVPPEYVSKMHEKITRKQRAQSVKEEIDFNPDDVNHVVLTAKLLGA